MRETSNFDIDDILRNVPNYHGTFSRDQLPVKDSKKIGSWVINMGDSKSGGTHWVCLFANKKCMLYIDSFGLPPPEEVLTFMKRSKKAMVYNDTDFQRMNSASCGWFAMLFILELSKGNKFLDIMYHFFDPTSPAECEKTLEKYFSRIKI